MTMAEPDYYGDDAADYGNPPDERDVQRAPSNGPDAANIGTSFERATEHEEDTDTDEQ